MEPFLFDDFFVSDDDPGIEVTVSVRGRDIPLRIRPLSVSDQVEVQAQALVKRVSPEGQIVVDRLDESKANSLLLAKSIVSWPFTYGPNHPQAGQPVPVTPENCAKLLGEAGQRITQALGKLSEQKAESLVPFVNSSTAA